MEESGTKLHISIVLKHFALFSQKLSECGRVLLSLLLGYGKVRTFVKLQIRMIMKKSIKRLPKRTQEKLTVLLDL